MAQCPEEIIGPFSGAVKGGLNGGEESWKVIPYTQFSLLLGVQEEGERKEEKDEKPHALPSYMILEFDAGRLPFNIPTILAQNIPFSYVFPTFPPPNQKETRNNTLLASTGSGQNAPLLLFPGLH